MTDLNITLSQQLQTDLGKPGVWAYALYWDSGGQQSHTLVDNGAVSSPVTLSLGDDLSSGKIYFLIQSEEASGTHTDLTSVITEEDEINWVTAGTYDYRWDSVELTLSGASTDVVNLTSIDGFGLPMELSIGSGKSIQSRGYATTGDDIFTAIAKLDQDAVVTYKSGPLAGQNRAAVSPAEDLGTPNTFFPADDWSDYVASLKTAEAGGVEIAGFFLGGTDADNVYHNPGFYAYDLEWDAAADVFWLSPDENSEIKGYIRITPDALQDSLYQTEGDVGIYTAKSDSDPYQILNHADLGKGLTMNSGENNQWGAVLAQFFNGFNAAYYGNEGKSLNDLVKDTIGLSRNWNWDPTYAFGNNLTTTDPAYPGNAYAEIFFNGTNSYGWTYSDLLMSQYAEGGPQLPIGKSGGGDVGTIDLTIFSDGETGGYTKPVIYNDIKPAAGSTYESVTGTSPVNNIVLNFANAGMVLSADTELSIEVLTSMKGGTPTFQNVKLDTSDGASLWSNWTITKSGDTYSATAVAGSAQPEGSLILSNLPVGKAGLAWYRIDVGSGDALKTFNLYAQTQTDADKNVVFTNPTVSPADVAIDGLASIAGPASTNSTVSTFTVNFLDGTTTTVDPSLLERSGDPNGSIPSAPVVGYQSHGAFEPVAGQNALKGETVSVSQGSLLFGWTGLADAANTPSFIAAATNKVNGLDYAAITVLKGGKPVGNPVLAQADIDGQWVTDTVKTLGNGTYTVTMTEHVSDDGKGTTAVGLASEAVTVKVGVTESMLQSTGTGLTLFDAAEIEETGSWVALSAEGSDLPNGATLLVYAVDEAGEVLSRDGTRTGVGYHEAVRGMIGTVHADDHGLLLEGRQSIYLEAGSELRLAVLTGADGLDVDAPTTITQGEDGLFHLDIAGMSLKAEIDNTLSEAADLAGTQRSLDEALLYLTEGSVVDLSVVGSTAHVNTLAFVRVDIGPDGAMSVDGVDYGDTNAFRRAVERSIDNDFTLDAGGNFTAEATWVVDGESGYYAPVLFTQTGNTFVIGHANSGGNEQIRLFGENTFGFEDLARNENSDFDYNDMVMTLSVSQWGEELLT